MAASDAMSIEERRKYLKKMEPIYRKSGKRERGRLLDEMEAVTGMHRKSLNQLLRPGTSLECKAWKGRRKRTYGPGIQDVVAVVWESLDYICAERMTPRLLETARHLHGQAALRSVQGLNLALLVHAQHDRLVRRIQVKAEHVDQLLLERRVGGDLERSNVMRLKNPGRPHPLDRSGLTPCARAIVRQLQWVSPGDVVYRVAWTTASTFSSAIRKAQGYRRSCGAGTDRLAGAITATAQPAS